MLIKRLLPAVLLFAVAHDAVAVTRACKYARIITKGCAVSEEKPVVTIGANIVEVERIGKSEEFRADVWKQFGVTIDEKTPAVLTPADDAFLCCPNVDPGVGAYEGNCEIVYTFACEKNPKMNLRATSNDPNIVPSFDAFHPKLNRASLCRLTGPNPSLLFNVGQADTINVLLKSKDQQPADKPLATVPLRLSEFVNGRWQKNEDELRNYLNQPGSSGNSRTLIGVFKLPPNLNIEVVKEKP